MKPNARMSLNEVITARSPKPLFYLSFTFQLVLCTCTFDTVRININQSIKTWLNCVWDSVRGATVAGGCHGRRVLTVWGRQLFFGSVVKYPVVKLLRQSCRITKLKKIESNNETTIVGEYKYERHRVCEHRHIFILPKTTTLQPQAEMKKV